jgi:hypothetical protein
VFTLFVVPSIYVLVARRHLHAPSLDQEEAEREPRLEAAAI